MCAIDQKKTFVCFLQWKTKATELSFNDDCAVVVPAGYDEQSCSPIAEADTKSSQRLSPG